MKRLIIKLILLILNLIPNNFLYGFDQKCVALLKQGAKNTCKETLISLERYEKQPFMTKSLAPILSQTLGVEYALNAKNCASLNTLENQSICWALREWKDINELRKWYKQLPQDAIGQKPRIHLEEPNIAQLPDIHQVQTYSQIKDHLQDSSFPYYFYPKAYFPDYLVRFFDMWNNSFKTIQKNILADPGNYSDKTKWNEDVYKTSEPKHLSNEQEKILRLHFDKIYDLVSKNREFHSFPFTQFNTTLQKRAELKDFFCRNIPLGGILHLHTSGIPDKQMTKEIYEEFNLPFKGHQIFSKTSQKDQLYPNELSYFNSILNINANYADFTPLEKDLMNSFWDLIHPSVPKISFRRFETSFTLQAPIYNNPKAMDSIYYKYLALLNPKTTQLVEFTEEYPINADLIPYLTNLKANLEAKFNIKVHFQFAFYRDNTPTQLSSQISQLLNLFENLNTSQLKDFSLGLNLIGMEEHHAAHAKASTLIPPVILFNRTNGSYKIPLTIHAGETKGMDINMGVRDSLILSRGLARIDHGISIIPDDVLTMSLAMALKTPFNMSINSNLKLGRVKELSDHPFLYMARLFPVTLSPDDPGIFNNSMINECESAISLGANLDDFRQMALNNFIYGHFSYKDKVHAYKIFSQNWSEFIENLKLHL